jgi:hypothetical protein
MPFLFRKEMAKEKHKLARLFFTYRLSLYVKTANKKTRAIAMHNQRLFTSIACHFALNTKGNQNLIA